MTLPHALGAALVALSLLPAAPGTAPAGSPDVAAVVAGMSEDELIGQMTWTHVYGSTADDTSMAAENRARYGVDTPAEVVEKYGLGGVLYFAWAGNTDSPEQVAELSAGLQDAAAASSGVPLAITVDQEGGEVSRIGPPATTLPGGMALGATFDPELARAQGEVLGTELAAMGVNVDFAPVADLNTNPANPVIGLRSPGADPDVVAELTAAQVEGLQSQHVAAAAKHFPGHGDTDVDSHTGLPVVAGDALETHLEPFRGAIEAGVDIIMSAHIVVESLDPELPGTLSPRVLTDLLRGELGYTGLVTTDALDMAALKQLPGNPLDDGDIAVLAIQAGSDIHLDSPDVDAAFAGIRAALDSGDLTRERLEESVTRILEWKAARGIWDGGTQPGLDVVGSADHRATATAISERAATMLRNEADVLPLDPATDRILVVGAGSAWPERLTPLLEAEGFAAAELLESGDSPGAGYRSAAAAAAADADAVVVAVDALRVNPAQQALVADLAAGPVPVVTVLAGTPYDLAAVPDGVAGTLASYGAATVNFEGVAAVVSGRVAPTGRLPVEVTAPDGSVVAELGFGLRTTTEVTPAEVAFADPPGTEDDVVTVPDVDGVTYLLDGESVGAGDHRAAGRVVVTAQADEGFHLAMGATARWEHVFDPAGATAAPSEPATGTGTGSLLPTLLAVAAAAVVATLVLTGLRRRRRRAR
ncbi:glycoside hydrolase family 3 protein [Georgenia sp. H159]|uniref:glycoside hydrolase family 3 protein n=1 Tax=Georgenia sp. H159 TaxID=3076115 RepID=UPI002D79B0D1|nr:glycoside hydrolase family 3 N-terminal domain-containing protein [Georgenia sp. H159]